MVTEDSYSKQWSDRDDLKSQSYAVLAEEYTQRGGTWPVEPVAFAAWAVRVKRWQPSREAATRLCAEQFSRAMREEYITDPKGRKVRMIPQTPI